MEHATDKPTGPQRLYRPPTQSSKPKICSSGIPNAWADAKLVDTAAKCSATASSPSASTSQCLASMALAMVSCVVNVLLTTMNKVFSGFNPDNTDSRCAPSTLLTKCVFGPPEWLCNPLVTINGPKSDPPIPMFTTSVISLDACIDSAKSNMRSRTASTPGMTCWPFTEKSSSNSPRIATCNTALPSV